MLRIVRTISLLWALAIPPTATFADECFCLVHTSSGAILRGCEARNAFFFCTDPYSGKKEMQKISTEWKRVEPGAEFCAVCRPPPRDATPKPDGPRGDDDEKRPGQ
jgi:hypothetical protein